MTFKGGSLPSVFYGLKLQPAQLLALTAGLPAPSFPGHPSGSPRVGPFQMLELCLELRPQWDEIPLLLFHTYSQF